MSDGAAGPKGFSQVDRQPDPAVLIAGMEATARWPAVGRLRRWERERLRVGSGDAVLDVGCGPADVLTQLAAVVAPDGRAVGVDASEQMLAAAAARAGSVDAAVELQVGDAAALPFPDGAFDAVRCERTLQWMDDPAAAVAEMVRVTRAGGRICVLDTDWRTLVVDHPSPALARTFLDAMAAGRGSGMTAGGRLVNLLRDAGVAQVEATAETHVWTAWDPDESVAPSGFVPFRVVAGHLVDDGLLSASDADGMVTGLEESARRDRFFMAVTIFGAAGVGPG